MVRGWGGESGDVGRGHEPVRAYGDGAGAVAGQPRQQHLVEVDEVVRPLRVGRLGAHRDVARAERVPGRLLLGVEQGGRVDVRAEQHEPVAEQVVEARHPAGRVPDDRLRDHPADHARVADRAAQPAAVEDRRRDERRLERRDQALGHGVHRVDLRRRRLLLDDAAELDGQAGVERGVGPALGLVGVEPRVVELAAQHPRELPAEVVRVADAGLHARPGPRRHQVRGVAGEEDPAVAPGVGHPRVVAVERPLVDLDVVVGDAHRREQRPDLGGAGEVVLDLAGLQRDLPAVVAGRERDVDDRALPVGPEGEEVAVRPPALDLAVDDDPLHVEGVAGEVAVDHPAGAAAAAVGAASTAVTVTPSASWARSTTSAPYSTRRRSSYSAAQSRSSCSITGW